jgi:hypothetical protein
VVVVHLVDIGVDWHDILLTSYIISLILLQCPPRFGSSRSWMVRRVNERGGESDDERGNESESKSENESG